MLSNEDAPAKRKTKRRANIQIRIVVFAVAIVLANKFINLRQLLESIKLTVFIHIALVTCFRLRMSYKWPLLIKGVNTSLPLLKILSLYYQFAFLSRILTSAASGDALHGNLMAKYAYKWDTIDQTRALTFALVSSAIRLATISPGEILLVADKNAKAKDQSD